MALTEGTATINFGALPIWNTHATITVTGQTGILTTDRIEAFVMDDSTAEHNVDEHRIAGMISGLCCGGIVPASSSFVIDMHFDKPTYGNWSVRWVRNQ